jgi:hypothetical protein
MHRPSLRPFWGYYGGKWRAAPHYPAPQHDTIVEPFAGSAGYALRHHGRNVVLVEKNAKVAATWRYLLRVSASEVRAIPLLGFGQTVDDLPVVQEARWLVGWWLNRAPAAPRRSPSSWMRAGGQPSCFWGEVARERVASQVDAIRHWRLIEGDYTGAPDIEATWFVDPPYALAGKHYPTNDVDYGWLAEWCRARSGQVMVCENDGADWLPFVPFRKCKANEGRHGGKVSAEAIWVQG